MLIWGIGGVNQGQCEGILPRVLGSIQGKGDPLCQRGKRSCVDVILLFTYSEIICYCCTEL